MLMDAELVEDYIYQNLYAPVPETPGYTLYLFNFSRFDSADHSQEHWYRSNSVDFDSNTSIKYWFSGYNDIPYVPTLGWGGEHRFCFLDLTARSWYYDWIMNVWSFSTGSAHYYDYTYLDEFSIRRT